MFYNRRQFLIVTGGLVGIGFSKLGHQFFSKSQPNLSQDVNTEIPESINPLLLLLMVYMLPGKEMLELLLSAI